MGVLRLSSSSHPSCTSLQATGQHFTMDSRFSLGDLLALGLHNHVDACTGVDEVARRALVVGTRDNAPLGIKSTTADCHVCCTPMLCPQQRSWTGRRRS